jgi:hypothetical protein
MFGGRVKGQEVKDLGAGAVWHDCHQEPDQVDALLLLLSTIEDANRHLSSFSGCKPSSVPHRTNK